MSTCCPSNSLPYLRNDVSNEGECKIHNDLHFYEVGNESSSCAVLIIPDVWGWNTGRVRVIADYMSKTMNSLVVIPKLLVPPFEGGTDGDALPPDFDMGSRGSEFKEYMKTHPFSSQQPKLQKMVDYLGTKKLEKMFVIGVCWGGYCATEMLGVESLRTTVPVVAAASPHPSVGIAKGFYGIETLDVVKACPVPFLYLPAGNDPDDYREGGDILAAAAKGSECLDFPSMSHGFFTRGDTSDPTVAKDGERAVNAIKEYFEKF